MQLKHRIIGIVVLVILMVILAPLLFNGTKKGVQAPSMPTTIPAPPPQPTVKPINISSEPAVKQVKAIAIPIKPVAKIVVKKHFKPQRVKRVVPHWIIQVASFSVKTNAERLVQKLKAHGYIAYSKKFTERGSSAYRVFVKQHSAKQTAAATLKKLRKELKLHGIIVREKLL